MIDWAFGDRLQENPIVVDLSILFFLWCPFVLLFLWCSLLFLCYPPPAPPRAPPTPTRPPDPQSRTGQESMPVLHMSYSPQRGSCLNSMGLRDWGLGFGLIKGDAGSLDYSSKFSRRAPEISRVPYSRRSAQKYIFQTTYKGHVFTFFRSRSQKRNANNWGL